MATERTALLSEDNNVVTLQHNIDSASEELGCVHLEVTDIEVCPSHGDVTGLPHVVGTVKPTEELPVLQDHEDGRGHRVHSHYETAVSVQCWLYG